MDAKIRIKNRVGIGAPGLNDLQDGEIAFDAENGVQYVRLDGKLWSQQLEEIISTQLWAWGRNSNFQTAQGTSSGNTETPTQVGSDDDWKIVSGGGSAFYLALKEDGTLWSWGRNGNFRTAQGTATGNTETPAQVGSDTDWVYVSNGTTCGFAIKENGTLWSWGSNAGHQTAQGTGSGDTEVPTQIGSDTDWKAVKAAGNGVVAIKTDGTLWSWGSNLHFQTAQGASSGNTETPTQIGSDTDWMSIFAGDRRRFAIKEDGTLWSWGNNSNFGTAQGTATGNTETPTQVGSDTDWSFVSLNHDFISGQAGFAIKENGTLWSWGSNAGHQTAQGTDSGDTESPTQVGSDDDWSFISSGEIFAVAIKEDGTLWSWGSNGNFRTAQGTSSGNTETPTQVGSGTGWKEAACSLNATVALKSG